MESEAIYLEWFVFQKWLKYAQLEIINRFNLKQPEGYSNCPSYCFVKKNTNRYFRKHLGFTYNTRDLSLGHNFYRIDITDHKKLMLFRIKYGL